MNNEPVAWINEHGEISIEEHWAYPTPLYTHLVKEHFEDEPQAEELHEIMQSNAELTDEEIIHIWNTCETDDEVEELVMKDFILFARAILRRAQEK